MTFKNKITLTGLVVDDVKYTNKMTKKNRSNTSIYINGWKSGHRYEEITSLTSSEVWYCIVKPLIKFAKKYPFLSFTLSASQMPKGKSCPTGALYYNASRLTPFDLSPLMGHLKNFTSMNKDFELTLCVFLNSEGVSFEDFVRNNKVDTFKQVEEFILFTEFRLANMKWEP